MKTEEEFLKTWRGYYYPEHVLKKLLGEDGFADMERKLGTEFGSTGTATKIANYYGIAIEDVWRIE